MNPERYDRQIRLEGFGKAAQQRLADASVLIVGAGGLGVPSALYLNAMGIGRLGIVDGDQVELSNLHRQPLYSPQDIGKPKIESLRSFLERQNPDTCIRVFDTFFHASNALEIMEGYDLVIDATDNLATRYLIDDACLIREKAWVYGALHGYEGQVSVLNHEGGPTYRCLFPRMPGPDEIPDCNQLGTLGILPGIIGSMQALEAVKVLCGLEGVLTGTLWLYNALEQEARRITFRRDPSRKAPARLNPEAYQYQACRGEEGAVSLEDFLKTYQNTGFCTLVDVREPSEFRTTRIPGALNIPLLELESQLDGLPAALPVYFVCKTGPRSRQAFYSMRNLRPEQPCYWVQGGMRDYKLQMS